MRIVAALVAAWMVAGCGLSTETPPPRFDGIAKLLEPGGVSMELLDPSRLDGSPVSREAAERIAREAHAVRGPGELEPVIDHVETYAAKVTVQARPRLQVPGGTHTAWLVALVEPDVNAAELVIVGSTSGSVVPYDSSPVGVELLP